MQHIQPNLVFMKYSILDHWQKYSIHLEANSEILKHKKCLYRASLEKRVKIIKNAKEAENISQNYLLLEILDTILKKKLTLLQICDWSLVRDNYSPTLSPSKPFLFSTIHKVEFVLFPLPEIFISSY